MDAQLTRDLAKGTAERTAFLAEEKRKTVDNQKAGLRDAIAVNKERAAELEKSIGAAFRPQGEVASSLARIGGERGIAIARNVPEKQLNELQAINKGIEIMGEQLKKLDNTPRFP